MSTFDQVIAILEDITATSELHQQLDLRLYDRHLLDSLGTVELIIALSEAFAIDIAPTSFDPAEWATPRLVANYVEHMLSEVAAQP